MRNNLLTSILLIIGLLLGTQFLVQKLGLTATLVLLGVVAVLMAVGYLVSSGHPLAAKLAARPATRPLVRLVCLLGGMPLPAPPPTATATAGGPAPRTPADFDDLNRRWKNLILGQDAAVDATTDILRQSIALRTRQGDTPPARPPLAVLFLVGGDGLGKRSLLEAVGRAVYPDGRVTAVTLAADEDPTARIGQAVAAHPCHTLILERLEAAGPKVLDTLRRAIETGDLKDPATGAAVPLGACVFGLTTTDPRLPERLGAGYQRVVGRALRFADPEPLTVAQVVVRLMEAECRSHKLTLDYADEDIVVRLTAGFDPRHGYRLTAAHVSEVLAPEIYKAIEHQHDRLALVEDGS